LTTRSRASPAGETTFVVTNEGKVGHEMHFGLLPDGVTVEEAALGEGNSGAKVLPGIDEIAPGAAETPRGKWARHTYRVEPLKHFSD
jgi:hypothetical protein